MAFHKISSKVRTATLEAVVTRADGTVENLGVIAEYDRRWSRKLLIALRSIKRKIWR